MRTGNARRDTQAAVKWEEVWWWCEEIRKRWGYQYKVTVFPPLPSQTDVRFTVAVELLIMDVQDPRLRTKMSKHRPVSSSTLTAETIALQLAVELHRNLDNEELERERSALVQGAMF